MAVSEQAKSKLKTESYRERQSKLDRKRVEFYLTPVEHAALKAYLAELRK